MIQFFKCRINIVGIDFINLKIRTSTILIFFDIVKVDGSSMSPTLHDNDRLVVTKMQYTPNKGDIIIFDSNYKRREEYISEYEDVVGRRLNIIERAQFKVNRQKRFKTEYYVKRIIALPEQIVDVRDGDVYVDDVLLDEDYNSQKTYTVDDGIEFPVKIDENYVFVLGDNRGASNDSRSSEIALIPYEAILGKSQARIFPLTNIELTK